MIYLIASHNTRIQCLINLIKTLKGKQIRFKNCCVIRIEFNESEGKIDVKLVYSGSLGDAEKKNIFKRPYYVSLKDLPERVVPESQLPNTPDDELDGYPIPTSKPYQYSSPDEFVGDPVPNSQLTPERFPDGSMTVKGGMKFSNPFKWGAVPEEPRVSLEQKLDFTITKTTTPSLAEVLDKLNPVGIESHENPLAKGRHIFYIVRHGQAKHNVSKPNLILDTNLTTDGQYQAKLAGEALLEIMKQSNEFPDVLLVSDLKRTHQTLSGIITNMLLAAQYDKELYPKIKKYNSQEFVILPCASELSESANDGHCDLDTANAGAFSGKYAPENFPSCTKANTILQKECGKINDHPLNWSYYLRFYGEAMRFELGRTSKPTGIVRHCRDTNMLYNVLEFMKNYANPVYAPSQPMGSSISTRSNPFQGGKTKRKKNRRTRKTNRRI